MILAIDPGPTQSAFVLWDGERICEKGKYPNDLLLQDLRSVYRPKYWLPCVIEEVASYGMPVGREVFQTVRWCGRFEESVGAERVALVPRLAVKMHLCHDSRAKDANIRQALIDRFGAPGTKRQPGLLYGVSGDVWAALALAVTWWDKHAAERAA